MKKVLLVSANLGSIDSEVSHVPQLVDNDLFISTINFTDKNFPPRFNALHPRLQAKIPKMLAWEYFPDFDYYVWLDGSVRLTSSVAIRDLIIELEDFDIGLFPHPDRASIKEELDYLENHMNLGSAYFIGRYGNEPMQDQTQMYLKDDFFKDDNLFIGTYFIYTQKLIRSKSDFFKDWFYHCSRYSVQDQLSLPYLIAKHKVDYKLIKNRTISDSFGWSVQFRNKIS